jgi:NADPH-dependent glutamate synthase beta subunit-like oxidoreductase
MFETPYDPTETEAPHDWITQSTSSAFADEDARRGTHYSVYISKLEAISLAAAAISNGDPYHDEVTDDFCDQEYLYGEARKEVMVRVFEEFSLLREFFTQP